jgi:hypothetical protein
VQQHAAMNSANPPERSWFRSAEGVRLGLEIAALVAAKIGLLVVLYLAFVAAQPRADTSPAALRDHVLAPAAATEDAP